MSTKFITCVNPNMTFLLQSANTKLSLHTSIHTHICFTALWTLYGITWLSQYKKGKTNVDFTEARNSERQWHQLAICKYVPRLKPKTMPAPHHSVFIDQMPFLPCNQQRQSIERNTKLSLTLNITMHIFYGWKTTKL